MGKWEHQPTRQSTGLFASMNRQQFLRFSGATIAIVAGVSACTKENLLTDAETNLTGNTDNRLDFSDSQDSGYLNYLYALEQLEAAFYVKLTSAFPAGLNAVQQDYLQDIRRHELVHAQFFKAYLGTAAVSTLTFDFSSIDFTSLQAVMTAARTFEDLGVAAYNGVIAGCKTSATVILASQIASVEARHAAWVRNQLTTGSFATLSDLTTIGAVATEGRDALLPPAKVLEAAAKYITTKLNVINL